MIHSFLMMGQSNMAGRGFLKEVQPIFNEHIKMLRNGRWQIMTEPVNYDRPSSGVGPAASFAAAWQLKNEGQEIGLIPCADGGSSLDDWAVGSVLFEHAVFQAKLAQKSSRLEGILWHQGESDCFPDKAAVYYEKLSVIIAALRRELDVPEIPLLIGGLADFLTTGIYGRYFTTYPLINQALRDFADTQANCYFVTADGLAANPDGLHINAASQRLFGIRYFEAFDQLRHINEIPENEAAILRQIQERPLSAKEKATLLEIRFGSGELTLAAYQEQVSALD